MQNRIDSANPTFQRPIRQIQAGEARETSSAFRQTAQRLECLQVFGKAQQMIVWRLLTK